MQAPEGCRDDIDKQAYGNAELKVCRVIDAKIVLSVHTVSRSHKAGSGEVPSFCIVLVKALEIIFSATRSPRSQPLWKYIEAQDSEIVI
jgi:hypothetical protein